MDRVPRRESTLFPTAVVVALRGDSMLFALGKGPCCRTHGAPRRPIIRHALKPPGEGHQRGRRCARLDAAAIRKSFVEKLFFEVAKFPGVATRNDHYSRWPARCATGSCTGGSLGAHLLEEQRRTVIYLSPST